MAKYSPAQLYDLARNAGLDPTAAVVAAAVALAESGGDSDAVGDESLTNSKWGPSVGLWQIRSLNAERGTGGTRDATRLKDPTFNARSMVTVYREAGSKFSPWSVFTSGRYRDNLDTVTTAANQPRHPRADDASGSVENAETKTGGPLGGLVDAAAELNPFAAFANWQSDLTGIVLKLGVTAAALALVIAGVKAAAGDDE